MWRFSCVRERYWRRVMECKYGSVLGGGGWVSREMSLSFRVSMEKAFGGHRSPFLPIFSLWWGLRSELSFVLTDGVERKKLG